MFQFAFAALLTAWLLVAPPLAGLRKSVFLLEARFPGTDAIRRCTAFAVGDKRFVTAAHCVDDAEAAYFLFDAHGRLWGVNKLVAYSANLDVAVILSDLPAPALALGNDPTEDEEVLALVGTGGAHIFSLRGRISGNAGPWLTAQLFGNGPGASGSPVFCGDSARVCAISLGQFPIGGLAAIRPVSQWQALLAPGTNL